MTPLAWPYSRIVPVMFRDIDAFGHVNNAVYLTWLEQVRNTCYLEMLGRTDFLDRAAGLDFVVARAEVDYLAPVHFGDAVTIATWPVHVGGSSFAFAYDGRKQDGSPVLRARAVLVTYDWASARSKPIPAEVAAALRAGLGSGPTDTAT